MPSTNAARKCCSRQGWKRLEVTSDANLQIRSEDLIATALESLETGSQQTALSLAMNRYSSFCAHPAVDIPPFPITPTKISLFLSRVPTGPLPLLILSVFPQPDVYPIPVAGVLDPNLTPDESTRVTQELVRCWVDAFSFAQMATRDIWEPVLDRERFEARAREDTPLSQTRDALHPSLRPIKDDFVVREIIAAVESYEHMQSYPKRMDAQRSAAAAASSAGEAVGSIEPTVVMGGGKGKTKWTKGGKAVAAPSKSTTPTTPLSQRDGAGTPSDFPLHGAAVPAQHASPPLGSAIVSGSDWNATDLSYYPQLEAQLSYAVQDGSTSYDRPPVADTATDSLFPVTELRDLASHAKQIEQPAHRRMTSSYASLEAGHAVAGPSTGFSTSSSVQHDAYSSQTPYGTGSSAFARSRHVSHDPRLQTVEHGPPRQLPAMQPAFTSQAPHPQQVSRTIAQASHAFPFTEGGSSTTIPTTTAAPTSWHPSQAAMGRRDSAIDLLGEAASLVEARRDQHPFAAPFDAQTDSSHALPTAPSMQRTVSQPSWAQSSSHDPVRRLSAGYPFDPSPASQRPKLQHQPASYPFTHRSTSYANSQLPLIDEGVGAASHPSHLPPTPYSAVPGHEFDLPSHGAHGYTTHQYQSSVSQWRSSESYTSSQAYPSPAPPSTGHFSTSDAAYEGFDDRYSFGATQAPGPSDSTAGASIGLGIQLN
ncbi:Proteophosphoglycan ppg4 [Rhodotorula toruloides]|nr:Proteophosphoglycan ppg4 [Rhodotorula toruloides]